MPSHAVTRECQDVLTRIARQRRRLDRRASTLIDHSLLVGSWRTYVEQHPGRALLAAAGVGMTLSLLASGGSRVAGQIGRKVYDAATGAGWGEVWREIRNFVDVLGDEFAGNAGNAVEGDDG